MGGIGDRIRSRRTELGLSQEELAKKVGYSSRSTVNKIEKGTRNPKTDDVKKIASALKVDFEYLLGDISIETYKIREISDESHLFDYAAKLYGEDTSHAIHLFSQLKEFDRGKIIGMMEQMLNTYK